MAEKLDVAISTIEEDATNTANDSQTGHVTALPTHAQYVSSLAFSNVRGTRVVTQYNQCAPAPFSSVRGTLHVVAVSPFAGFVGIRMREGFVPTLGALPTSTGRATVHTALRKETVDMDDAKAIGSQYTWEGKTQDSFNDRVHPEAYRAFDDTFIGSALVANGWARDAGYETFDPVIVKLATRKERE